jgi:hypothetical protein
MNYRVRCWHAYDAFINIPCMFPGCFGLTVLLIFLVVCVVQLCVFTFSVPCCEVRYDFRIKTMIGSSLRAIVCRRAHVLFMLFVFVCIKWWPTHIVLCFCFVLPRLVNRMLPISLDCQFLIALRCSPMFMLYFNMNH